MSVVRLYELARGVDESKVVPDRPTQSISAEDRVERDVPLTETESMIRKLAELTWAASRKESGIARTVVLKLKTAELKILTRSRTPSSPPSSCEELTAIALSLRERVALGPQQRTLSIIHRSTTPLWNSVAWKCVSAGIPASFTTTPYRLAGSGVDFSGVLLPLCLHRFVERHVHRLIQDRR